MEQTCLHNQNFFGTPPEEDESHRCCVRGVEGIYSVSSRNGTDEKIVRANKVPMLHVICHYNMTSNEVKLNFVTTRAPWGQYSQT